MAAAPQWMTLSPNYLYHQYLFNLVIGATYKFNFSVSLAVFPQ